MSGRRAYDLPTAAPWARFLLAPLVTVWQGLSLTRILAVVFAAILWKRPVGFNDVLGMFVILGACVAKDNFGDFEKIGKLIPRWGRREEDPLKAAAAETVERAKETAAAATAVVEAVEESKGSEPEPEQGPIDNIWTDNETGDDNPDSPVRDYKPGA